MRSGFQLTMSYSWRVGNNVLINIVGTAVLLTFGIIILIARVACEW